MQDINTIESDLNLSQLTELLEDKKSELQEIRNHRLKGHMIRSRTQWLDEGERPTKYFCGLETKNYVNKTIKKLKVNDSIITDQTKIMEETKKYYQNLFSNKDQILTEVDLDNLFKDINIDKLSDLQRNSIESPMTMAEISNSLYKMNNNRTPGSDGFPADFYKVFWSKIKHFILRAINESYNNQELSITWRNCLITCLPKGNKDRELGGLSHF